jgi:hypothetical protein
MEFAYEAAIYVVERKLAYAQTVLLQTEAKVKQLADAFKPEIQSLDQTMEENDNLVKHKSFILNTLNSTVGRDFYRAFAELQEFIDKSIENLKNCLEQRNPLIPANKAIIKFDGIVERIIQVWETSKYHQNVGASLMACLAPRGGCIIFHCQGTNSF